MKTVSDLNFINPAPARGAKALLWTLAAAVSLGACSGKHDDLAELSSGTRPPVEAAPPITPDAKKPEPPKYVYPYLQQRDPFIPLVGGSSGSGGASSGSFENLGNLELRGIIKDRRGKAALISSSDGDAYVLRSGRVYDRRNRVIAGVQGVIKENSVVLISQNKAVKELPLIRASSR